MGKLLWLIILTMLLVLPFSIAVGQSARTDYNESGNQDNQYQLGLGGFNSVLDPDTVNTAQTTTVLVTDGRKIPLVSDLDGDGFTEVIILDGRNIEIYQNKSLTFVTSFTLDTSASERFSNILLFDIDGDELREIILFAETEVELHILEYNRSVLVNQTSFNGSLSGTGALGGSNSGEAVIKCSSVERCLMVLTDQIKSSGVGTQFNDLFAMHFNSTINAINPASRTVIDVGATGAGTFCLPNIRHIAVADYDGDNGGASADPSEFEFIYSNIEVEKVAEEKVNIYWIDILPNRSVQLDDINPTKTVTTRPGNLLETTGTNDPFSCDNSQNNNVNPNGAGNPLFPGFYVSSPLVMDADPTAELETIVGFGIDPDEFIMEAFEKDGTSLGRFPATLSGDSEGIMISNVFQADIFDDSSQDFCLMGFNGNPTGSIEDSLSVTCGSPNDLNGFGLLNLNTLEFRFNKDELFNITQDYDTQATLAHSAEMNTANNIDEVVSAYGVLELDRNSAVLSGCFLTGDCDMDLVFEHRKTANEPRVITTDAFEKFGLEDMIIFTDLNLFYLDDGASNQPASAWCGESGSTSATCSQYTVNPCLTSTWKINTSVRITVTPKDPEGDLLTVRARLYAGTENEFDSGNVNVSSGAEFEIDQGAFTANQSGGGFQLILTAFDAVENPNDIQSVTKQFSVAQNGVETFDCTSSFILGLEEIEEALPTVQNATFTTDASENAVSSGIQTVIDLTGVAGTTFWLILMIAFSVAIYFRGASIGWSGNAILGAIAFTNTLFLVLGARFGVISIALIVILVVVGVVIIGVFLGRFLTGIGSQNNG